MPDIATVSKKRKNPLTMRNLIRIVLFINILIPISLSSQNRFNLSDSELLLSETLRLAEEGQFGAIRQNIREFRNHDIGFLPLAQADLAYYDALSALELKDKDAVETVRNFKETYRGSQWNNKVLFLEGRVLFSEKKYAEALRVLQEVDTLGRPSAENGELAYRKGFCLLRQNNADEALIQFEEAIRHKSPFRNASLYYAGHIYYSKKKADEASAALRQVKHLPQYKKIAPYYLFQIAYWQGDYEQVKVTGSDLLQNGDSRRRAEVLPLLADACFKTGQTEKALEYYAQLEKLNRSKLTDADYYQMGLARYEAGQFNEAAETFRQLKGGNDSLDQNASYLLAQCYLKTNQKIAARLAFLNATNLGSDETIHDDALMNYARLALETGNDPYQDATTLLAGFIAEKPDSPLRSTANELLVKHYLVTKNYDEALSALETSRKGNPSLQAAYERLVFGLATDHFNQQQYDKAILYFRKLNSTTSGTLSAQSAFWIAESYFRIKDYVEAQRLFKQFAAHKSAAASGLLPLATYGLAYTHFQLRQYSQALPLFKSYLAKPDPQQPALSTDAQCRIADCHFIAKSWQAAIDAYSPVALSKNPESDYALFQSAMAYGSSGRMNNKLQTLGELTSKYRQSVYYDKALYEMGSTYLVMNDPRSAIVQFDRLVKERPRSAFAREAMLKIGLIYFNNNQPTEATRALTKVAEDYPGTPDAREALNALKAIFLESNNIGEYFKLSEKLGFGSVDGSEQDSLSFLSAENLYNAKKNTEASEALNRYIEQFPQGRQLATAHYYLAKINENNNKKEAVRHYSYLAENTHHPYQEETLKALARMAYDDGDYASAHNWYSRLQQHTDQPLLKTEALEGSMKCSYFTNVFEQAITEAEQLLANSNATSDQRLQAQYIAGKSLLSLNRLAEATSQLKPLSQKDKGALGAEAAYLLALIHYRNNEPEKAENQIFDIAEKFRRQDYWVAKSFILLADVYVKQNNIFQAKETLKSIVENYKGEDLKKEAQTKLNSLK